MANPPVETHRFAKELLTRRNEYVRFWKLGNWVLVHDLGKPAPEEISFEDLMEGIDG